MHEKQIMNEKHPLLQVEGVTVHFTQYTKELHEQKAQVITDVQLTVNRGEIVAVIGASGSGKSLLAHMIVGLLPENAHADGKMHFKGEKLTQQDMTIFRGKKIALIPQSINALNPLMKASKQVQLAMKRGNKLEKGKRQAEIFTKMNLDPAVGDLYP